MNDMQAGECPFCGSTQNRLVEIERGHWIVECEGCAAIGPGGAESGAALTAWNQRAGYTAAHPS